MKTVTIRDFRTRPKQVQDALKREREAVLTASGRPVAVMIPVDAGSLDKILETLRRARARGAPVDPRGKPTARHRPDAGEGHHRHRGEDPESAIPSHDVMRVVLDANVVVAGLLWSPMAGVTCRATWRGAC